MFETMGCGLLEAHEEEHMPGADRPALGFEAEIELMFGTAYRLREVAEKLGISHRQVQAHVDDGSLVAVNVGRGGERRDLRVLEDDLDGFVKRRKVGAVLAPSIVAASAGRKRRSGVSHVVEADGYAARRAARILAKENGNA